ncbi:MAG TPA: tetratricopeptide repeat protein [Spirochaetota bacterium]
MEKRTVTIHRSGIENFLMEVKRYVKSHKKPVALVSLLCVVLFALVIGGLVYYDKRSAKDLHEYETIITTYQMSGKSDAAADDAVKKLSNLVDKSWFGYVHRHGYYIIAGILFEKKRFEEAGTFYIKYADKTNSAFTPLALFQAGICAESLGHYDRAAELYKRIEKQYKDSAYNDRVLYDLGRIAEKKGENAQAKDYFTRMIAQYPNSAFAASAKSRLFLIGISK